METLPQVIGCKLILTSVRVFIFLVTLVALEGTALAAWKNPFPFTSDAGDFRARSASKEKSRWTLKEWLEQKERNHMMDLWLGMYSPSPYEIILTGSYLDYQTSTEGSNAAQSGFKYSGGLAFYALILGLEAQYENNWKDSVNSLATSVNLRVMGNAVQGTHLNIQYGVKKSEQPALTGGTSSTSFKTEQQFVGGDFDLYVDRYIGLHANYRSYLPTQDSQLGDLSGQRTEYGLFFDVGIIRLFGQWFSEKTETNPAGVKNTLTTTGIESGLKIFF